MKLEQLRPMLLVPDLKRTMDFYCGRLGFKVAGMFGEPPVWCDLMRDGVSIMFNTAPPSEIKQIPPWTRDYQVYYFSVKDVAGLHREWEAAGLPVSRLRVTTYEMKEFELRDPDRYWLWFGEWTGEMPTVSE